MPDRVGGTELYTRSLAREQVLNGNDVSIAAPSDSAAHWPKASIEDGIHVYRFPGLQPAGAQRFRSTFGSRHIESALNDILERAHPELIHIQHMMGIPIGIIGAIQAERIPYLVTLHDYWYLCANAQLLTNYDNTICDGPNWWINCARCGLARMNVKAASILSPLAAPIFAARERMVKKVLDGAVYLIAPTDFVSAIYRSLGTAPEKIVAVPHGIEVPASLPLKRQGVSNRLHAGYIGGLSWQKGVHVLIQAFNNLPSAEFVLSIWGEQQAFPEYVDDLKKLADHPGIKFHGALSRDRFWSVLSDLDVVIVPSLWYETSSIIIQEAFAAGVPVIASDLGVLSSRVNDDVDGLLVPPDDAPALTATISKLLNEPEILQRLQRGIGPVKTIEEHAAEIEKLYKSALNYQEYPLG
jgi:glycosyltransferase involved in cell wall biosynthesis